MAYDAEQHSLAQRYLVQALRLAFSAEDEALCAEILAAMSHQMLYLGHNSDAVDLAAAARRCAGQTPHLRLIAETAAMEAHAHGAGGDEHAATAALRSAEQALARTVDDDSPEWLGYLGEAYLAAKAAHCFSALGQARLAEDFARRSLHMDDRYVRGRAFNTALLASACVQLGSIEEACSVGREALELTAGLRSARSRRYVRDLHAALRPYADTQHVRDFDEQFAALVTPAVG